MSRKSRREGVPGTADPPASTAQQTSPAAPASAPAPETTPGPAPESILGKSAYLTEYQQDLDLLKLNQLLEAGDITQADYDEQKQKVLSAHPGEPKADTPGASGLEARRQDPPGAG